MHLLDYFTDPVLRAPTIGCMLMCFASSLVGVLVFIRKRSLLGESLSHASYPGVVLSALLFSFLTPSSDQLVGVGILAGAFLSALLGFFLIDLLEKRFRVKSDAALCLILSVFFGVGVLLASRIQITHALWYKQIQIFLYGQAATMTDVQIVIYSLLALVILCVIGVFYRKIEILYFDREFAKSVGVPVRLVDQLILFLLVLAIVVGIRSVGIVLMSGMLIAPPIAGRQCAKRLPGVFFFSGFFGLASGFLGNYFSVEIPLWLKKSGYMGKFSLPTGPLIILCAATICVVCLLFAKESRFKRSRISS